MIRFLVRIVMFVAGALLLLDAGLPSASGPAVVERHHTRQDNRSLHAPLDLDYQLEFSGHRTGTCSVGYTAYNALHDGDAVDLAATKILGSCLRITRGQEKIYETRYWRLAQAAIAVLLLAVAFGWIESDEDGRLPYGA